MRTSEWLTFESLTATFLSRCCLYIKLFTVR